MTICEWKTVNCSATTLDRIGFRLRKSGVEIRDVISLGNLFVILTRSSSDKFLDACLRRGTVLNIENARIDGPPKQATAGNRTIKWGVGEGGCSYEKGTGATFTEEGRWPANFIYFENQAYCLREASNFFKSVESEDVLNQYIMNLLTS